MNRSDIRGLVRFLLNEDIPGFWSNAQLNQCIDLANQKVNSLIGRTREDYFTVTKVFTCVANQGAYAMPLDCRFIRRMEVYDLGNPTLVTKIDEIRFPRTEANGDWLFPAVSQPKRYTVYGTQFNLLPIPDAVYNIRIYYDQRKDNLPDDDDIPLSPVDFHEMIAYWACVIALRPNSEDASEYVSLFNDRKADLINMLLSRGGDETTAVEAYLEGVL